MQRVEDDRNKSDKILLMLEKSGIKEYNNVIDTIVRASELNFKN